MAFDLNAFKEYKIEDSSQINLVKYYTTTRTLEVHFTNGKIYEYYHIPEDVVDQFLASESKGSFIQQHLAGMHNRRLA